MAIVFKEILKMLVLFGLTIFALVFIKVYFNMGGEAFWVFDRDLLCFNVGILYVGLSELFNIHPWRRRDGNSKL